VIASLALGVALLGGVPSASSKSKPTGTIILVENNSGTIAPGEIVDTAAKCPSGYSIVGGSYEIGGSSVYAHATAAAIASKQNLYGVTVVNPPPNPVLPGSGQDAKVLVGADCARTGTAVVPVTPYKQR
jgi:hypothetical protein